MQVRAFERYIPLTKERPVYTVFYQDTFSHMFLLRNKKKKTGDIKICFHSSYCFHI